MVWDVSCEDGSLKVIPVSVFFLRLRASCIVIRRPVYRTIVTNETKTRG